MNLKRLLVAGLASGALLVSGLAVAQPAMAGTGHSGPFANVATHRCIDDSSEGLRALECNGTDYQEWEFYNDDGVRNDDGLRNVATGNCLEDSSEGGLRAVPCTGSANQKWGVFHYGSEEEGLFLRQSGTGRCVDDSVEYGLRSFDCNRAPNQDFTL
jgi:hypothetical protein